MPIDVTHSADPLTTPDLFGSQQAEGILEAVRYVQQSRQQGRHLAVVIGEAAAISQVFEDFADVAADSMEIVRLPAPTDSSQVFLEAVLAQLGFEPLDASADELLELLAAVMQQASDDGKPLCIAVEDAQDCGPRVLETLCDLIGTPRVLATAPLFLLMGSPALDRVLDSPGMSRIQKFATRRFRMETAAVGREAAAKQPALAPELVVSVGDQVLRRICLEGGRILIGRSRHCDLLIQSRFVSRHHALLVRTADGDWLMDLHSTNGTTVNARAVTQHALQDGDVIGLGDHRLQYLNADSRNHESISASCDTPPDATVSLRAADLGLADCRGVTHPSVPRPSAA